MRPFVWRGVGGGKKNKTFTTRLTRIHSHPHHKPIRNSIASLSSLIANLLLQRKLIFLLDNIFMLRMMRYLKDTYMRRKLSWAREKQFLIWFLGSNLICEIKSYNMRMTEPPRFLSSPCWRKNNIYYNKDRWTKSTDVKHSWCKQSWQYSWCFAGMVAGSWCHLVDFVKRLRVAWDKKKHSFFSLARMNMSNTHLG